MRHFFRYVLILSAALGASATAGKAAAAPDLGPNVLLFNPQMPVSQIQAAVDQIANRQVDNEMGTQRYALLFLPGTYGDAAHPLIFQVGYYTEVAGLGASPKDVVINGSIDVYNRCVRADNCMALVNFWRSLSNLTIQVAGPAGCRANKEYWAVSQAAPMRRVNIVGGTLSLSDFCTAGPHYSSGGFIADSQVGQVINGTQQQFITRDSVISGWSNGSWNQVFAGVIGAPAQSFPKPPYTTLDTSPATRERPFLFANAAGAFNVFVPALRSHSSGTSWNHGPAPGIVLPLAKFFIATPATSVSDINAALASGHHLILTPGIYRLDAPIVVSKPDTVVLGLGFATLASQSGNPGMTTADVPGVKIAGLLFDAGPINSPVLLEVGPRGAHAGDASDPTTLSDVFFRIGGARVGKATVALTVNSNNVLLDDIWSWRADHGDGVGWTVNTSDNGVIVNGKDVTAYGLFVEHFQKYDVIWNGENGRTIMFQNEMPYDPPDQASWMHGGVNGYASYKVADSVRTHEGWGLGSYCFFNVGPPIESATGFEVPDTPGVKLHDVFTIRLNGHGTIDHVVNRAGAVAVPGAKPSALVSYP